jgi:hypothetical protein
MRLVGIIAVFVLTVTAIIEGASLIRLSGKVDALTEQLKAEPPHLPPDPDGRALTARSASAALAAERMRPPPPKLDPKAAPTEKAPAEPAPQATGILREALATPEGREHLKNAMELLREKDRQERVIRDAESDVQRDNNYRDRMAKALGLSPGEQGTMASIYTNLQTSRQKIIDEMRSGQKSAEQADDEIRNLENDADRTVRNMLGEGRMRQLREARRTERQQRREQRQQQNGQPAPPGQP